MADSNDVTAMSVSSDATDSAPSTSSRDMAETFKDTSTCVSRFCDQVFRFIGELVADHPKKTLMLIFLFTALSSAKVAFTPQEDDLKTGYTPIGARSYDEFRAYQHFYDNAGGEPLSLFVFVTARNGTMHTGAALNESIDLLDHLGSAFPLAGRTFYQFCTDFCALNEPIRQFRNGIVLHEELIKANVEDDIVKENADDRLELSFPFMSILGKQLDLSPNFFGVKKFDSYEAQVAANSRTDVQFLKLVLLQFRADKPLNATKNDLAEWERSISDYVNKEYQGEHIRARALTATLVADEVVRTGMTLFPYISVGFLIMALFSILSVRLSAFYYDQWTAHKLHLAVWGCICPLLATSSALGLLFWLKVRFSSILAVTPFLIMAIGVDDAYLMIHAWQRICARQARKRRLAPAGALLSDDLREQVAEMVVEVGPSITITSLTNFLAFGVGMFAPTPEIRLFCLGNAVAILFDYVYQLLMYVPIIVLVGRREMGMREKRASAVRKNPLRTWLQEKSMSFMSQYCAWLSNGFTSVLVALVLVAYWVASLRAAATITARITPDKLFLADSLINEMNDLRETYIIPSYTPMTVFVNDAANLSDPRKAGQLRELVARLEAEPLSLGADFTHFWLRDYDRFMEVNLEEAEQEERTLDQDDIYSRQRLDAFLNWPEYRHWGGFLRFDNETGELAKCMVVVGFHGADLVQWELRARLLDAWRAVVAEYAAALDASAWADDAAFLDQIATLWPVTWQSALCTLFCMLCVCAAFMRSALVLAVAALAILSVCAGVCGGLARWGLDLDPISMATTIMSIGFSVDFPAHITYHYYRLGGGGRTPAQRICTSLVAIGYPLLQCGLSTVLFVTCLLFVRTYMSEVFVKTMVLVVSLGVVHGLLVIPAMLCACSNLYSLLQSVFRPRKVTPTRFPPKVIPIGSDP